MGEDLDSRNRVIVDAVGTPYGRGLVDLECESVGANQEEA